MTGDMGEIFNSMRLNKKMKHEVYFHENLKAITESKIKCQKKGEVVLFREEGKPKVDYYLSANSWRHIRRPNNKMMYGNAISFLNWYKKQKG